MEVHVSFRGRKPVPQHVDIGMERENKVMVLCFEGLPKWTEARLICILI